MEEEWRVAQEILQVGWPSLPSEHSGWRLFLMIPILCIALTIRRKQASLLLRAKPPQKWDFVRGFRSRKQEVLCRSASSPAVPLSDVAA